MQNLTAAPRSALTEGQVLRVLNTDALEVEPGLELLDGSDRFVADITGDLVTGEVEHQCYADVHGTVRLTISRTLSWVTDRVRPFVILTDPLTKTSARFNLGVYTLQTPERVLGESVPTYSVSGTDKTGILNVPVGDTYSVDEGANVLDAVKAAIVAAGAGTYVNLGGPAAGKTLPSPMVWTLTDSAPVTWLKVVNDLLAAVGYVGIWSDADGFYRSGPSVPATVRNPEWRLSVDDPRTSLVSDNRTERYDGSAPVNAWRFVKKDMGTAPTEVNGGIYIVRNFTQGPYAINNIGRTIWKVLYLDATDPASLKAQGDALVQADFQFPRTLEISTAPLPHAAHFDVLSYTDAELGGLLKTQARSWALPLDGSDMTWTLEVLN